MLAQVLGASTRAFELMLAAFILGIALGGLWIRRRIDDLENPEAFLGYVQIAMGVAAAATLPFYDRTFDIMAWALGALQRNESGYALFITVSQSIAMLVMLPATFFAGMTLPLLTYTLMRRGSGEKAIGQVYSANTVGAIVGVLCAVHLLMPMIGVKGLIIAGGLTDIGLGSILLFRARTVLVIFSLRNNVGWAVAGVILAVAIAHQTDPHYLISSVYRHGNAITNQTAEVLFLRDGKTATVSLFGHRNDYVSIATNGKVDAGINLNMNTPAGADEITMTLAGALALAYNPRAQMVANIGMGSGLTTHVLLSSDQLRRVDTVEIEPLMVRAAREGFGARAQRAFDDPRSQIHFEDAKTFFSLHQRKYDAIISEPSNPWVSGVASLFSQEFYKHVLRYLADDGVFVQWLQIYETDTRVLASVLQALSREFSDYVVYCANDSDVLIIAKKSGGLSEPDWQALSSPFIAKELNRVGINSLDDIRRRLLADEKVLAPLLSTYGSPVNSDFFPFVDQHAPRALFLQRDALELTRLTLKPIPLTEMLMRRPQGDATGKPTNSGVFSRDALGEMAVAMRDGALDANRTASASLRKSLRIILAWAENCSKSPDGVWLDSLQEVAGSAVAQLRPQELAQMFEAWVPPRCSAMLSEQQSQWLAFYKAMGQRDGTAMASAADSLLALAKDLDGNQRGLLFTSGLLGKLAEGNKQGAAAMWNTYAPAIVGNGSPSLPLRLLAAHALTGS
jgi:spermidine synthase